MVLARHHCSSPTNPAPKQHTRLSPRSASRVGRFCFGDWSQLIQSPIATSRKAAQVNFQKIEEASAVKIGVLARHHCGSPTNPAPKQHTRLSPRSASRVGRFCFGDWSQSDVQRINESCAAVLVHFRTRLNSCCKTASRVRNTAPKWHARLTFRCDSQVVVPHV